MSTSIEWLANLPQKEQEKVLQSLASSTAERSRLPRYCSSFASNRENRANESAAEPAKPARIWSLNSRRIFRAPCLTTVSPNVTCPSPAMTVFPAWRTDSTVVLRIIRRAYRRSKVVSNGPRQLKVVSETRGYDVAKHKSAPPRR